MALIDSRGYDLTPDLIGEISRGLALGGQINNTRESARLRGATNQIRGILADAQQGPSDQQSMLAEQSLGLGEDQAIAAAGSTEEDLIKQAKRIDPLIAEQVLNQMGMDSAGKRAEASRFASTIMSMPLEQQNAMIKQRAIDLKSQGRNPSDTLELLEMSPQERQQALIGIQLADLSTKERVSMTSQMGGSASMKSFAPVTIVDKKTGEKRLVSPTVDPRTGKATLNPFDIPEGFEISKETDAEKRAADVLAAGEKTRIVEEEKARQQKLSAADVQFSKKLGDEGGKIYSDLQKAAQSASAFIPRLEGLKELASKLETGAYGPAQLLAKRYLGIDSADDEVLNAKLGELAQDILNQQTGTKTDFDFQNAVRQSASLGKTKKANIRLIQALIDRQQEAVSFGDQVKDAYNRFGVKGVLDMRYKPETQGQPNQAAPATETYEQRRARLLGL